MERMRTIVKKTICIVLYLLILLSFLMSGYSLAASNESNQTSNAAKPAQNYERSGIIVSLGDSYSSGEGIEEFYNQDIADPEIKYTDHEFLAHRSKNSWPSRLVFNGQEMTRDENWFFTAVSGAETKHILETQEKQGKINTHQGFILPKYQEFPKQYLAPQIDVFKKLNGKKADYVTLTLGGNDAGFAGIVAQAATGHGFITLNLLEARLLFVWSSFFKEGGIRDSLEKAYKDISGEAGSQAKIIVAGYPQLFGKNGSSVLYSKNAAEMINEAVSDFNRQIEHLAESLYTSEMQIHFVSVEKGFEGYEAYSSYPFHPIQGKEREYIRRVEFFANAQDIDQSCWASAYSMHPNDKGAAVYAACVQHKIDELEGEQAGANRDVVLSLDVSGSMSGQPINETKKAAASFINSSLQEGARVGLVAYNYNASVYSDFTRIESVLQQKLDSLYANGGTNIEDGLRKAEEMLINGNSKKQILVLMSDGCPNDGLIGEELIEYAETIKDSGILIYTLGFFDALYGSEKTGAQSLMERIASEGCHYEVENAEDLVFFFNDMSDQINGQKYIYIRIACPVDVSVTYDGETLTSKPEKQNTRTSFGTLTFEESENEYEGTDNRVKILRLKDGADYNIKIKGNGRGKMNYTIGFMDDDGEYSDIREFKNIRINKKTTVNTVAANASDTVLKVDTDGDGKVDEQYKAGKNESGKLVEKPNLLPFIIGGAALLLAAVLVTVIVKGKKRKAAKAALIETCQACGSQLSAESDFCGNCGAPRRTAVNRD